VAKTETEKTHRSLRERLPHRPRRYWRYVSPQRRGVALLILAMVLLAIYGYWYLTNDSRIRRQAIMYLRDITGANVDIENANFNLFGDITLENVSIDVSADRAPFFSASKVILKHRPWSVFFGGTIRPTEVVSLDAEVTDSPATRAFMQSRSFGGGDSTGGGSIDLPVIRVASCRYNRILIDKKILMPAEQFNLRLDMNPDKQQAGYEVYIAEQKIVGEGKEKTVEILQKYHIAVQLFPAWNVTIRSGSGVFLATKGALPPEYRKWLDDYNIRGKYDVEGPVIVSENTIKGDLKLKLDDFSLRLPESQGGLSLSNVSGTLIFSPPEESPDGKFKNGRIELKQITGKLVEAGGVAVKLSGDYLGYSLDSPFNVNIEIDELTLPIRQPTTQPATKPATQPTTQSTTKPTTRPATQPATQPRKSLHPKVKKILDLINRDYSPIGTAEVAVSLSRAPGQKDVSVYGTIKPKNLSAAYRYLPYRVNLDDVTEEPVDDVVDENLHQIYFNNERLVVKNIIGQREGGSFKVNVNAPFKPNAKTGKWDWTVTIDVDSAKMTEALRKALPSEIFIGEPYPLRKIHGRIHAADKHVWVEWDKRLRALGPGDMKCDIDWDFAWTPKGRVVKVNVEASNVPIDKALIATMNRAGRDAMGQLNPSGVLERLSVEVSDSPEKKLSFEVGAELKDVNATYKGFPYTITKLNGDVTVTPKLIVLENMVGRHGQTPIKLNGKIYPGSKNVGVDISVSAGKVLVDKELYQALGDDLKKIWDSLKPKGQADVEFTLKQNLPDNDKELDYHLEIRPRGMTVTYEGFPYKFSGIRGLVTAEPGVVTLQKIQCDRSYRVDGEIRDNGRRIKLKIDASGVPLDKELIAAMPRDFTTVLKTVTPGGTLDIKLDDLTIIHGKAGSSTTKPAKTPPKPVETAATRPSEKGGLSGPRWQAAGVIGLHDTTINVAFGAKKLNGKLNGQIRQDSRGMAIDLKADLKKILIGNYEITDVKGRLTKKASGPLVRIENLEARAYGGRLAGREVMIRMSDPVKYAFSLFYQNVSLSELVNAGAGAGGARTGVLGQLEGKISLEATAGDPKSRRAAGTVVITKGKMYKMPILLGLMHVLYLSLPGDSAFTDGHLKYFVLGDTMVIEEIFLTGSALSLVGSGKMTMANEKLDLTFLTGPPGRLPRIALIRGATKVLNALLKQLLVIRVTGSLSKPISKAVPLRSVDAILKELLSPASRKQ
jgi:hypothetical protein